ncbi:hypothetical protein NP493_1355g00011 [Ridgeia piscesae]|uniref:Strawberry notch AAA domain-containing protein n=1 Tax=Ridgeia piscesae TaxID=27915 RepID=A0AAD9K644_RIDPI|nr:hypothetical protein NP493_1355g00011 [Ridgeia piscesae]
MDPGFYAQVAASPHSLLADIAVASQVAPTVIAPIVITPQTAPDVATADLQEEIGRMAEEGLEETVSDEVFSSYKHRNILPGCRPHPGEIVEPGSLSALNLPPANYPIEDSLPQDVITSGRLSSLQLEGILYAGMGRQVGNGKTGREERQVGKRRQVGKGRQVAGIILDNFARGRTKHVWFSISSDLIVDATRDLNDIGCYVRVINGCHQLDKETRVLGLPADFKEGVVFSTYATLVSSVQKGGKYTCTSVHVPVTCTSTCVPAHMYQHTCTSTHVLAHMYQHTCTRIHVLGYMYQHTCTSTHVPAHMY